jgi:hypothetical protein
MKYVKFLVILVLCARWAGIASAQSDVKPAVPSYLITNDDLPPKVPTSGTFYALGSDGTPQTPTRVSLGGVGSGGGYFAANRVSVLRSSTAACAYLSLGGSGEISAIDLRTLQNIGNFPAAAGDTGIDNGIGMVNNGSYLYASYSTSSIIATFVVQPGCGLQFLSDISPLGKHQGSVKGMAVHGNIMVATYGDGSIESFDISAGAPVSHGDLQDASGFNTDRYPSGVDITQDGHYAVFGDIATNTTIEVSDISSGKLTRTALYNVGVASNSNNVYLSPDESLLYVTNTGTGQVSAEFFDKTTGKVSHGCTSKQLRGFDDSFIFISGLATQSNSGTGSTLYVAEFGSTSAIARLKITSTPGACSLAETAGSPIADTDSVFLLSIGVYPPRKF